MARKTHEEFLADFQRNNKHFSTIEILGVYAGATEPISCRCLKCGHIWSTKATNLTRINGRASGCPKCAGKGRTNNDFIELFKANNPHADSIEIVGEYTGIDNPIACRCLVCGYEWSPVANLILNRGLGCKNCSNTKKSRDHLLSHDEFIQRFKRENQYADRIEILGIYRGGKIPIKCRCTICGNTWNPTPDNLWKGKGCRHCAHFQTSYFEQFMLASLKSAIGTRAVRSRDRKAVGVELDIYLPTFGLAYELGSWYWHEHKVDFDREKRELCEKAGIRLITIYDGCETTKEPLLSPPFEDCILFPMDLGTSSSIDVLKRLVISELARLEINYEFTDDDWDNISVIASFNSRAMSDDEFRKLVNERNPSSKSFRILGSFSGGDKTIQCECLVCGKRWNPKARRLVDGYGCPQCARDKASLSRRKTNEQFVKDFHEKNPHAKDIDLLSTYVKGDIPIHCRCRKCGHEWNPTPEKLLGVRKPGCPKCSRDAITRKNTKTDAEFRSEFFARNPHAETIDIGLYKNNRTKIHCRCLICGQVWETLPWSLLTGSGCPNWRKHAQIG